MRTLDLAEAAAFLRMSPAVLREKARAGRVKAAKPGKRWVFLESDLAEYLGALYAASRQAPLSGSKQEIGACLYKDAAMSGGSTSPHRTDSEYDTLLGLRTRTRLTNITTGNGRDIGMSDDLELSPTRAGEKLPSSG